MLMFLLQLESALFSSAIASGLRLSSLPVFVCHRYRSSSAIATGLRLPSLAVFVDSGGSVEPRLRVAGGADGTVALLDEVLVGAVLLQLPTGEDAEQENDERPQHVWRCVAIASHKRPATKNCVLLNRSPEIMRRYVDASKANLRGKQL